MTCDNCGDPHVVDIEKVVELLRSLPSRGLYRLGGGYHAPSYDDAWRVAALEIRVRLGRKSEVPK